MSLYGYRESLTISSKDYGFYSLIMAAMRKADTGNGLALKRAFPDTWDELMQRYNAPGGIIDLSEEKG